MFNTAQEVIDLIEGRKNNHKGLTNFELCMESLGNPHLNLQCIHVAGTNGKGSTSDYIRSILQMNGYKVGTFTSPYLEVHNDRIRINNQFIDDETLLRLANQTYSLWEQYELSMFEIDMMLATLYFVEEKIDYAVIEVGMGGRLDATNIILPLISVITNIGLDHMEYLGNTHVLIAQEKAGIIKPNRNCITGEQREDCLSVMERICKMNGSTLFHVGKIDNLHIDDTVHFEYKGYPIVLSSKAAYQSKNAACAIEVVLHLRELGISISDESIIKGTTQTFWKGRFEQVHDHPLIFIDGAHNVHGIDALVESARIFPKVKILFSALKDKNTDAMIEKLLTLSHDITICEFSFYRAQVAEKLAHDYPVKIDKDMEHAIRESLNYDGVVLITGSLYFISLVREFCRYL